MRLGIFPTYLEKFQPKGAASPRFVVTTGPGPIKRVRNCPYTERLKIIQGDSLAYNCFGRTSNRFCQMPQPFQLQP